MNGPDHKCPGKSRAFNKCVALLAFPNSVKNPVIHWYFLLTT
jgi:hypothetical protein